MTVVLHDAALPACFANGQLRGALGTIGPLHKLPAELVVAGLATEAGQRLGDIFGLHLSAGASTGGSRPGGGEPQRMRLELEQPRRPRRGVAELKAQLDRGQIGGTARQQQITVADSVQRRRAPEGAADLVAADGLSNMVDDNERRVRGIAQPEQALAQRRHRAGVVLVLIVGRVQGIQHDDFGGGLARGDQEMIQTLRRAEQGVPSGPGSAGVHQQVMIGGGTQGTTHGRQPGGGAAGCSASNWASDSTAALAAALPFSSAGPRFPAGFPAPGSSHPRSRPRRHGAAGDRAFVPPVDDFIE